MVTDEVLAKPIMIDDSDPAMEGTTTGNAPAVSTPAEEVVPSPSGVQAPVTPQPSPTKLEAPIMLTAWGIPATSPTQVTAVEVFLWLCTWEDKWLYTIAIAMLSNISDDDKAGPFCTRYSGSFPMRE